jgi:hypothetical protein
MRLVTKHALITAAAAGVLAACASSSPAHPGSGGAGAPAAASARASSGAIRLSLGGPRPGTRPVAPGFLGVSLEYSAVEPYAGTNPSAVDPVLVNLLAPLSPAGQAVLRIGGDSTDWAWWPAAKLRKPGGAKVTLDPRLASVTAALAGRLGARLILGIDLEANSKAVAAEEGNQLVKRIGQGQIQALELGNEPELYGSFGWYRGPDGKPVTGRPPGYDPPAFNRDFRRIGDALPKLPLAGPATGAPKWMATLPSFLRAAPRLGVATLHRYPLQQCYVSPSGPQYPTVAHIFARVASRGLADSVAGYTRLAHAHGLPMRIDEMSTISCGNGAVGQSFASALWQLDALFEMARVGVDGVNIHSYPGAPYALFDIHHSGQHWTARVYPQLYGMLLFAQAAPGHSRLLRVSGHPPPSLHVWATQAPDGVRHLVVINEDSRQDREIALAAPAGAPAASVERLQAPSLNAHGGVTLAGRGFGASTSTGQLGPPVPESVSPQGGRYVVRVAAGSALMLTLPAG